MGSLRGSPAGAWVWILLRSQDHAIPLSDSVFSVYVYNWGQIKAKNKRKEGAPESLVLPDRLPNMLLSVAGHP